jgi:hypothetical protein
MIIEKLTTGKVRLSGTGVKQRNLDPRYDVIEDVQPNYVIIRRNTNIIVERFLYTDIEKLIRDDGATEILNPDLPTLLQELSTNFFFELSSGTGGSGYGLNRVVFQENFVGDGVETQFQLDGTLQNAVFIDGAWVASRIVTTLITNIVRTDDFKPTYDSVPNFLGNRIAVSMVSASGLVTLSHPPRNGIAFSLFYWYELATGNVLDDYYRPDFVATMEADNTRIDNELDAHTGNTNNPHQTTVVNLDDTTITAPIDNEVLTYEGGIWKNKPIPVTAYSLDEQTFDVATGTLPITTASTTTKLNIDFENFDASIDMTGQLPVNMSAGSRVVLRKIETDRFKVIYDDGVITYSFVNRAGDYLELEWTGVKFIV